MCDCIKKDYTLPSQKQTHTFHWGFGNTKLAKDGIVSFGLPAFKAQNGFTTCPNASVCALVCYARQGHYVMSHVQNAREHNLDWLRSHTSTDFIDTAAQDILAFAGRYRRVRIHDSGDFFTYDYMMAWQEIARQCKDRDFYGYTKMVSWSNETRHLWPDNFHLVQSVGGKEDSLIDSRYAHSIIFPTHEALTQAGYDDASKSDKPAYTRAIRVGLAYHGVAKLQTHTAALLDKRSKTYLSLPQA